MPLTVGSRLGPYEILSPLGAGGMAEVYRAKDTRLGREVAIKVLPPQFATDPERLLRFELEAHAVAALSHPNIVALYDVGGHEEVPFVVTELLQGETLKDRLAGGPLPPRTAVEIGVQIAQGLAAAHAKAIVHRDVKPANVFVTSDGVVKILDFGLAKLMRPKAAARPDGTTVVQGPRTESGMVLGTLGYISPEQLRGEEADARSDIFGFGCVLYQMLAGKSPFLRATGAETVTAIMSEDPPPLSEAGRAIAPALEEIVRRCLEKHSADRFSSAHDLALALRAQSGASDAPVTAPSLAARKPGTKRRWAAAAAGAALLVVAVLAVLRPPSRSAPAPDSRKAVGVEAPMAEPTSIAVLPFVNMSSDPNQEYFSDGLSEELLNVLSKVPQLRVISRTSSFQFKGKNEDIRTIAGKLNVAHVLEGSVRKSGRRIRITAQLVEATTGSHLWSNTYDRYLDDVFAVQNDIARSVANASSAALLGLDGRPLPSYGSNAEAYNLFLQAKYFTSRGTREGLQKATEYYEQALKLDPGRAAYWAGLAGVHIRQVNHGFLPEDEGFRQSRAEVTKALELEPDMAEAHALLGWIRMSHDWDWQGAGASLKKALKNGPGSAMVVGNAASLSAALGHLDEAIELCRRAIRLDPLNIAPLFNLSQAASEVGRLDEAEAALRRVLELSPDQPGARAALGRLFLLRERPEAAFDEIQKETLPTNRRQGLALAYHALGRKKEADAALAELVQKDGDSAALWIAEVYADRRDSDKAFEWLERAYAQHDPELAFVKGNRLLRSLEGDPRYRAFLRKMRLPEQPTPRPMETISGRGLGHYALGGVGDLFKEAGEPG